MPKAAELSQDKLYLEEHIIAEHYVVHLLKHRDGEGKTHLVGIFSDEQNLDASLSGKKE